MKKNSAIILLSGGLDSYVSLDMAQKKYDIKLALTFDYGQKPFREEFSAAGKIARHYNIKHKKITLPFLKEIKGESIWVPNRNGLFLNIAGCFCDAFNYDAIIFGANLEEAQNFPDNTKAYIKKTQAALEYSTRIRPKVVAPLINKTKLDTIRYAFEHGLDFKFIKSCYENGAAGGKKHCGKCPSCLLIKAAVEKLGKMELLEKLGF